MLVFISIVLMIPFVFIDQQIPKVIEFFTANLGEFEKIALRREGGGSSFYIYNLLASFFFPFVLYCVVAAHILKLKKCNLLGYILIFLVFLSKAAMLSKAPLVILLVQLTLIYFMCRSLVLSSRLYVWISTLVVGGFMVITMVANSSIGGVSDLLEFLFYRLFMIVNEGLMEYFSAIPFAIGFSWNPLPSWLSFGSKPATYWLVGEVHRGVMTSTTSVMFAGDAWAEMSWLGLVVVLIMAGGLMRFIDVRLIFQRGKGLYTVAGLALVQQGIFIALNSSFQTALFTGGLLFVMPLCALLCSSAPLRPNGVGEQLNDSLWPPENKGV
jgi:hypothetical protein